MNRAKGIFCVAVTLASVTWGAWAGPKVTVIGDSYSAFSGTMPSGYETYYTGLNCGVTSSSMTWWAQVIAALGGTLEVNNAWSGSLVCSQAHGSTKAFIHADRLANLGSPDLILVFGGTNDAWDQAPIGDDVENPYDSASWTDANLAKLMPAYAYLVSRLQALHPNAEILTVINSTNDTQATGYGQYRVGIRDTYANAMAAVAAHYGLTCVQLHDITKTLEHPDAAGMTNIANQVVAAYREAHSGGACAAPLQVTGPSAVTPYTTDDGLIYVFTDASDDYSITVTNAVALVKALVVGGGGAGGWTIGGGGGGGQVLAPSAINRRLAVGNTFTLRVGAGGQRFNSATSANASPWPNGLNGGSSVLDLGDQSWTALGGGGGGGFSYNNGDPAERRVGRDGACGGGGAYYCAGGTGSAGGNGGASQGSGFNTGGGGGGGASGAAGGDGSASASGAGGAGVTSSITGTALDYGSGGGGGGGNACSAGAAGGAGAGAGSAANSGRMGSAGLDGRGGGGGGGCFNSSANTGYAGGVGGSGCVILCLSATASDTPDFSTLAVVKNPREASVILQGVSFGEGATAADVWFACGTNAAELAAANVGTITDATAFTNALAGLVAGATYHYVIAVSNNLASAKGRAASGSFTLEAEDLGDVYPTGITLLESITSSGGASVRTGVSAQQDLAIAGRVRFDGSYDSSSGTWPVFGNFTNESFASGIFFGGERASGKLRFSSPEAVYGPALESGTIYEFSTDGHALTVNGTVYPAGGSPADWYDDPMAYTVLFGAVSTVGETRYAASVTLYGFSISAGGEPLRNFVPAKDADNVVCLFDRVSHKYFYNDGGSGSFEAGATAVDDVSAITVAEAELRDGVLTALLTRTNPVKALDVTCHFGAYGGADASAWAASGASVTLAGTFAAGAVEAMVTVSGIGDAAAYARFETSDRVWSPSIFLADIRKSGPYVPPPDVPLAFAVTSAVTNGTSSAVLTLDVTTLGKRKGTYISCTSADALFRWGLSPDNLYQKSAASPVTGTGVQSVTVTGLHPGVTVYGRLMLANESGEAASDIVTLRMGEDTAATETQLRGITVSRFRGREVTLTFGAASVTSPLALYVAWGGAAVCDGTNGFAHVEKVADVPPSQSALSLLLPAKWGRKPDCRVARFFFLYEDGEAYDYPTYIESTGTQYIKTGCYPASDIAVAGTVSVSAAEVARANHWWTIFGHFTSTSDGFCIWSELQRNYQLTFNRPSICQFGPTLKNTPGVPVTFKVDGTSVTVNGTSYTHSGTYNCSTAGYELPIFAFYNSGYVTGESHVTLYAFQMWKAGELVRDYVPVRVRATGRHTLLDRVSGEPAAVSYLSGSSDFSVGSYTNALPGGVGRDASRTLFADPRFAGTLIVVQ